jgi:hypothetical protein
MREKIWGGDMKQRPRRGRKDTYVTNTGFIQVCTDRLVSGEHTQGK